MGSIQKTIKTNQLETKNLCLLEERHCMRAQALELCNIQLKKRNKIENFKYSAGSIDSLMKFVLANKMDTLLPYLAAIDLPATEQNKIVQFAAPVPYRSVGIVVHKHFVRKQILSILKQEIKAKIDPKLPSIGRKDKQLQPI